MTANEIPVKCPNCQAVYDCLVMETMVSIKGDWTEYPMHRRVLNCPHCGVRWNPEVVLVIEQVRPPGSAA
ncbi:hypothetical protein GCM10011591_05960 [Nocardia camponoti]|uniref:Uncharacterized protein n=1 Tax=Nocardia camponoti TaxID=1616106 RepID=A0A917V4X6_9NOCA|nr:hypothetical protein GCM10011591_05960 [Nocardia camponoti]